MLDRERKTDDEWITLNKIKLPILLNYAQCKLVNGDYYAVIEHCNTVLQYDTGKFFMCFTSIYAFEWSDPI